MAWMNEREQRRWRRVKRVLAAAGMVVCILVPVVFFCVFPGQQASIAFTLATGVGLSGLQVRIDEMEAKAIRGGEFSDGDKAFLVDFYTCLAKGAKLTVVLGQSGRLMDRYLDGSGEPLELDESIFTTNWKVQSRMKKLRGKAIKAARAKRGMQMRYSSGRFHMPHASSPDSVFGLYFGTVNVEPRPMDDGKLELRWRAEVPWEWPSYGSLEKKYGDPHAESFPLPSLLSPLVGMLYVDNGLGEYLVQLGLAEPFVAYAEWDEVIAGR
jgi:hypothetical protein